MAEDEHRVKRSRFDQTEPEPRRSRFDRRSRSPSNRQSESARTRSPLSRPLSRSPGADAPAKLSAVDPAAAAAAAAAKINAQLQAKKGIQHVDVPPIRSADNATENSQSPSAEGAAKLNAEIYVADGDYIKDIEINDLRNRYTLTKGSTQKMIQDETGADVTTRGNYYPDKNMATAASPPLYLHVTSTNKDGLEKAVAMINDLMQKELPNLVDERRFRRREPEQQVERDEYGRRKWPDERIPIDLEPIPGFNLRAQVVGQGGAYVKHIQQQTRCRVQIKGRGSGFIESSTGRESDEAMFLHVAGPDANDVQQAKELCEDLLTNVKEQYQRFKENPPQHNYGGYGNRGGDRGDRGDRYQGGGGGGGGGGYGGGYNNRQQHNTSSASPAGQAAAAAVASPGAAATPTAADYSAQYAQYYGTADPYAAYGGYQNYVAYYQYYQQMAAAQQQADGTAPPPPASEAPPPPPGSGSPPPPPPGAGGGGYSAVPPPPGL
ncbi:K Homology domain type 1 [Penicillium concentricum]|uniref:K Homology domain type 1 n=1 Tax=Penicillium concentricum TaxID=293559 RepID=A0A9W9VBI7_9EURO|nr:K Homology domain type 1 [Penicillium concentricum]KAJ5373361.1 K Homology domain type 1 [Penicillium concentricum]